MLSQAEVSKRRGPIENAANNAVCLVSTFEPSVFNSPTAYARHPGAYAPSYPKIAHSITGLHLGVHSVIL